MLMHTVNGATS